MPSGFRLALIALLVSLVATAGVAGQTDGSGETTQFVENTTLEVKLQPDGDARWSVSATYDLSTANRTAAFRTVAEEFRDGETASLGLPAFRQAAAAAGESTGREMEITRVERSASGEAAIANGTGRLTLSFTWTNFANVDGEQLTVGDVFDTPGGTWLPGLDPGQRLVLQAPAGYGVFSASASVPAPQNGTLVWEGPEAFGPDAFSVTFTGGAGATTPPTDSGTPNGSGPTDGDGNGAVLWLVAALTLGTGVAVVYVVVQRRDERPAGATDPDTDGDETATAAGGATAVEGSADGKTDEGGEPADDDVDEELLSDEERVERLLERNGGRMKQASIVNETGWSNAKVSQLLSAMEEEDRIDKLRIGRENLISFPDEDVAEFEDE